MCYELEDYRPDLPAGAGALVLGIDNIIVKAKRIAAQMLDAEADDVE